MKRRALAWKAAEPADRNASRVLPQIVRDYFRTGRKLDRNSSARAMHRFRLKTKHLRYTLEAFMPLYGPGLKSKLASLRAIQNVLGELNDCEVLLAEIGGRLSVEVKAFVNRRKDEKRREFLRYWRQEFDAENEHKKWEVYLTRFARSKRLR
jgi:CHAD domain-containing protein